METETLHRWVLCAFVLVVAVIAGCNAVNVHTRAAAAAAMQQSGADPLDIPCAIGDGTERYCQLRAASKAAAR